MNRYFYFQHKNGLGLTDEQKIFYEKNGFIVFRKLVDDRLLDQCKQRFIDICNGKVADKGMMTVVKAPLKSKNVEGEFLINKVQDFAYDDILSKYIFYKLILDILQDIIGPNITALHTMLINKPPNCEEDVSRQPLHQDLYYLPFRPVDSVAVSWTAMEQVNEMNGCLFVVPGSHKKNVLHKHEYPQNINGKKNLYHEIVGFDHLHRIHLPMEKGDTVFLHSLLLHGSGPNLTKGFRKSILCHYASSNCYFINVEGTIQENIAKGFEQLAIKQGFPPLKFQDYWKYKSRTVKGEPGNFERLDSYL